MTRDAAVSTAHMLAARHEKTYLVYRFPAWPLDVYGLIEDDHGLAPTAQITARVEPAGRAITMQANLF